MPVPVRNLMGGITGMIACLHWCKQTEFDLLYIVLISDVIFLSEAAEHAFF